MIVPSNRLMVWVAAVLLPSALLLAAEPGSGLVALGLAGALVLAAAIDAFGAPRSLAGIRVELPPVTRMSKDREGRLELRIANPNRRGPTLRLALALPPEIPSAQEDLWVGLPREAEWSACDWPCKPSARGSYHLRAAYLEGQSRLGFWHYRAATPLKAEIRVYPNLFEERRNLAALFLNRGAFGLHAQRQVGKGREFEKLREYLPGDSFDEIHWKATARRGRPVTKVFQIERTQEVYVVVDASRLSARPVPTRELARSRSPGEAPETPANGLERFITAALVLGLAAEQQGDLFGLVTFTDKVERFVRARNGKAHYSACRDALYTVQPKIVTPDFDEVCSFIRLRLRRRSLVVMLTALDDPVLAESFVRGMDLVCRQHLVLVNMLQPAGVAPLFARPDTQTVDDIYERLGGHLLWGNLRQLEKVLNRRGVRFHLLQNERLSADLVSQYLAVKQRQLL